MTDREPTAEQPQCCRCGQCCRNNGPIPPFVKGRDSSEPGWLKTLCKNLRAAQLCSDWHPDVPCVFLEIERDVEPGGRMQARCTIYKYRPQVCRDFDCKEKQ